MGLATPVYAGSTGTTTTTPTKETDGKIDTPKEIVEEAQKKGTVSLAGDVEGSVVFPAGTTATLNLNGHSINNSTSGPTIKVEKGANITIKGSGTVNVKTDDVATVLNNGTLTLNGGTYTRENTYYTIQNHGVEMTINSGVTVTNSKTVMEGSLIENGYYNYTSTDSSNGYVEGENNANPKLTINGGDFSYGNDVIKNDDGGELVINNGNFHDGLVAVQNVNIATINGGTFSSNGECTTPGKCVINNGGLTIGTDSSRTGAANGAGKLTITGGTYKIGSNDAIILGKDSNWYSKVEISGGAFTGAVTTAENVEKVQAEISLTGGTYAVKPDSDWIEESYEAEYDGANYIVKKTNDSVANAEVVTGTSDAAKVSSSISTKNKDTADKIAAAVKGNVETPDVVKDAAETAAKKNTTTISSAKTIAEKNNVTNVKTAITDGTAKVVYSPRLDITVSDAKTLTTDSEKYVTLDITPVYDILVATSGAVSTGPLTVYSDDAANASSANAIVVSKGSASAKKNVLTVKSSTAVTINNAQTLLTAIGYSTNDTSTDNDAVYVVHSSNQIYDATVTGDVITFTAKDGFSPFKFTVKNPVAAEYNGTSYTSLQGAVDAALSNSSDMDPTVTFVGTKNESATVTPEKGKTVIVTVINNSTNNSKATINGPKDAVVGKTTSGNSTTYSVSLPEETAAPGKIGDIVAQPMYRLYNPNSGEHFYTASTTERNKNIKLGWRDEGIGWYAPSASDTPVYRLYNPNAGDHHYTMSLKETKNLMDAGWNFEGIGWYSDDAKTVKLYREYNPNAVAGAHNYTTAKSEHNKLVKLGWKDEGTAWYGVEKPEDTEKD